VPSFSPYEAAPSSWRIGAEAAAAAEAEAEAVAVAVVNLALGVLGTWSFRVKSTRTGPLGNEVRSTASE
jgi:hypothetical protein